MKNMKGSLILLLAAFLWGSTFVAQTAASKSLGTFTYNASRSFVGAVFLSIVITIMSSSKKKTTDNKVTEKSKWPIAGGIACGLVLFFAMGSQQFGIGLYPDGVAASGRSGFITAIYVVLVAVFEQFRGKKLHVLIILSVFGATAGMYFLCVSEGITSIYLGDVLELVCALCFTMHILVVDKYKDTDSTKLSCLQFLVAGTLSLITAFITETIAWSDIKTAIIPILYAGILSSGVAYTLQMVGQKYAEPAVASIVMSLESVFAVLTGWLVLSERMSGREFFGCVLVFASVIMAQVPEFLKKKE